MRDEGTTYLRISAIRHRHRQATLILHFPGAMPCHCCAHFVTTAHFLAIILFDQSRNKYSLDMFIKILYYCPEECDSCKMNKHSEIIQVKMNFKIPLTFLQLIIGFSQKCCSQLQRTNCLTVQCTELDIKRIIKYIDSHQAQCLRQVSLLQGCVQS